ncbi:MAG: hypothetical protein A2527_04155 [Candidatus Lambdaproteobacteria bacterium RIFOXYD2_FULL_50_16]|uniref:Haem-binding uptake Tiki superfamily ChaN domain-containing protein n=1 Tax=Candidatus Lambdaproteobacteria bacterium RIFOXYD2_FULL_50_16 TaxID=1817772 RepID=A0A1F6GF62_9PROT|nr:MAG: hypothetical protein A2527_04155 [Candidatus Lambdaproteobacteria bacterium RIFOXYD2_FULL_50_16]
MKNKILGLALLLLGACSTSRPPDPLIGQTTYLGEVQSETRLFAEIDQAQIILIGETHDNPVHHQFQRQVLKRLGPKKPVLTIELFAQEQTSMLMLYATGKGDWSNDLRKGLNWESQDNELWQAYLGLIEEARLLKLELAGIDLDRALIRRLTKLGRQNLTPLEQAQLPPVTSSSDAYKQLMYANFTADHCGWSDPELLEKLYQVWQIRNEVMAENLARLHRAHPERPIVVALGAGHIQYGQAVLARLKSKLPGVKMFALAMQEVDREARPLAEYYEPKVDFGPPFEWLQFTHRTRWEDPCETFKSSLSKHKQTP